MDMSNGQVIAIALSSGAVKKVVKLTWMLLLRVLDVQYIVCGI